MSKDYNYDIVILEDKIKDKNKWLLLEKVKDFKNVSMRFIDISEYFKKIKMLSLKTKHVILQDQPIVGSLFLIFLKITIKYYIWT